MRPLYRQTGNELIHPPDPALPEAVPTPGLPSHMLNSCLPLGLCLSQRKALLGQNILQCRLTPDDRARFLMEVWMLQFPTWRSRRNAPGSPKCSHHNPRSPSALAAPERGWLPGFLAAKLPYPFSHAYEHLLRRLLFKAALHASVWEVEKEKARRYTQVIYPKSQDLRPDVRGGLSYRFRTFTGKPKIARNFVLLLKFLLAYTWLLL